MGRIGLMLIDEGGREAIGRWLKHPKCMLFTRHLRDQHLTIAPPSASPTLMRPVSAIDAALLPFVSFTSYSGYVRQ